MVKILVRKVVFQLELEEESTLKGELRQNISICADFLIWQFGLIKINPLL